MARSINLADLEVNIKSNTKNLEKVIKTITSVGEQMKKQSSQIEKALRRIETGYQKNTKAANKNAEAVVKGGSKAQAQMAKQAAAVERSRLTLVRLKNDLTKLGADPGRIGALTTSFKALERTLGRGRVSSDKYSTAMNKFSTVAAKTRQHTAALESRVKKLNEQGKSSSGVFGNLRTRFDELGRAARVIEGPLGGTASRMQSLNAALGTVNLTMFAGIATVASFAFAFGKFVPEAVRVELQLTKVRQSLKFASGSAMAGAESFDFLRAESKRLGLDIITTGKEFAKFAAATRGTALAGEEAKNIFTAFAEASTVLSLSADETAGVFRALQQMISKGKVQAEELRGQLGERLPGAFRIAADSMGVTTSELDKMLESGEVLAEDLLPKMAIRLKELFGPEVLEASNNLNASINRLKSNWVLWVDRVSKSTGVINFFKRTVDAASQTLDIHTMKMEQAASEGIPNMELTMRQLQQRMAYAKTAVEKLNNAIEDTEQNLNSGVGANTVLIKSIGRLNSRLVEEKTALSGINSELERRKELQAIIGMGKTEYSITNNAVKALPDAKKGTLSKLRTFSGKVATLEEKAQRDLLEIERLRKLEHIDINLIIEAQQGIMRKLAQDQEKREEAIQRARDKYIAKVKSALARLHAEDQKRHDARITFIKRENTLMAQGQEHMRKLRVAREKAQLKEQFEVFERNSNEVAKELEEVLRIVSDSRTPLEKYNLEMERLNELTRKYPEFAEEFKRAMEKAGEVLAETDPTLKIMVDGLEKIGGAMADALTSGENFMDGLKAAFKVGIDQIVKEMFKLLVIEPIMDAVKGAMGGLSGGGSSGSGGGIFGTLLSAAGSIFGGFGGGGGASFGTGLSNGAAGLGIGFANGGEFTVGGTGGADSQMVGFRASPDETVSIKTPSQQKESEGMNVYIDARGADAAALARVEQQVLSMNGSFERRAVGAMVDARKRHPNIFK